MAKISIKKPWTTISEQKVDGDDDERWIVSDIIARAKDLPVKDIPMDHLCINSKIAELKIREFVAHMKLILEVDMSYPIILDEDGEIFDGRHRVARALLEGYESIKAVRFEKDPPPIYKKAKD